MECCSSLGHKKLDTTEWLNWTEGFCFHSLRECYLHWCTEARDTSIILQCKGETLTIKNDLAKDAGRIRIEKYSPINKDLVGAMPWSLEATIYWEGAATIGMRKAYVCIFFFFCIFLLHELKIIGISKRIEQGVLYCWKSWLGWLNTSFFMRA